MSESEATAPAAQGVEGKAKTVHAVERAIDVLEIVAAEGRIGATEIAVRLGVHKSTVSRLIASLQQRGFVEEAGVRGKYQLGFAVVRLTEATVAQSGLVEVAQPECDRLADAFGETVNLAVLDGAATLNVLEARSDRHVALRTWVGQVTPAHATATGKVLVSEMTSGQLRSRLGPQLSALTPNTITDFRAFDVELEHVRSRGWASTAEELEAGLNSIAVPVRSKVTNRIVASICVSGPEYRLAPDQFEAVALEIADAVARIEAQQSVGAGD